MVYCGVIYLRYLCLAISQIYGVILDLRSPLVFIFLEELNFIRNINFKRSKPKVFLIFLVKSC